jgi:hypothetical protein
LLSVVRNPFGTLNTNNQRLEQNLFFRWVVNQLDIAIMHYIVWFCGIVTLLYWHGSAQLQTLSSGDDISHCEVVGSSPTVCVDHGLCWLMEQFLFPEMYCFQGFPPGVQSVARSGEGDPHEALQSAGVACGGNAIHYLTWGQLGTICGAIQLKQSLRGSIGSLVVCSSTI